jgi:hypothetical protein
MISQPNSKNAIHAEIAINKFFFINKSPLTFLDRLIVFLILITCQVKVI